MLSAGPRAQAISQQQEKTNTTYNQVPDVLLPCNAPFDDDDMKIQGSKWLGRQWWQSMRNLEYAMYLVHQSNADNGGKHGVESLKMFKSIIQVLISFLVERAPVSLTLAKPATHHKRVGQSDWAKQQHGVALCRFLG